MSVKRSAIILAGGKSKRMNEDKGLKKFAGEPLINHVIGRVSKYVDEVLVIVSSEYQRKNYSNILDDNTKILIDLYNEGSPLIGAMTGFERARSKYALVTGCDMPFISYQVIQYLFEGAKGHNGAVFRWPNGWIEPLLAVYNVKSSLKYAMNLYKSGIFKIRFILLNLGDVVMFPIDKLRMLDPDILSLHDLDTEEDLKLVKEMLRKKYTHAVDKKIEFKKSAGPQIG